MDILLLKACLVLLVLPVCVCVGRAWNYPLSQVVLTSSKSDHDVREKEGGHGGPPLQSGDRCYCAVHEVSSITNDVCSDESSLPRK